MVRNTIVAAPNDRVVPIVEHPVPLVQNQEPNLLNYRDASMRGPTQPKVLVRGNIIWPAAPTRPLEPLQLTPQNPMDFRHIILTGPQQVFNRVGAGSRTLSMSIRVGNPTLVSSWFNSSGPDALTGTRELCQLQNPLDYCERPQHEKTTLCKFFRKKKLCNLGQYCTFAHGNKELRANRPPVAVTEYKKKVCKYFLKDGAVSMEQGVGISMKNLPPRGVSSLGRREPAITIPLPARTCMSRIQNYLLFSMNLSYVFQFGMFTFDIGFWLFVN